MGAFDSLYTTPSEWDDATPIPQLAPQKGAFDDVYAGTPQALPKPAAPRAIPALNDTGINRAGNFIGEPALQMLTGAGASIAGGYRGLYDLLSGKGLDAAANHVQKTQHDFTYQPQTESGKAGAAIANKPGEWIAQGGDVLGTGAGNLARAAGVTDPAKLAAIETAVNTGAQAVPMIFGPKFARDTSEAFGGLGGRTDLAAAAAPKDIAGVPVYDPKPSTFAPITNPTSLAQKFARQLLGDNPDLIDRAANAQDIVPGSKQTLAQVTGDSNVIATERAYRNDPRFGPQFGAQDALNNKARLDLINNAADPVAAEAALKARDAVEAPWTNQGTGKLHTSPPVDASGVIAAIDKQFAGGLGVRPGIGDALRGMRKALTDRNLAEVGPDGTPQGVFVSPDVLDSVRRNANDFLAKADPHGTVSAEEKQAGILPVKRQIVGQLDAALPGYSDYLRDYATHSTPLNTVDAVNNFNDWASTRRAAGKDAAGNVIPELPPQQTGVALDRAVKSQPGAVAPELHDAIARVKEDLRQSTLSNKQNISGSATAANLQAPNWIAERIFGPDLAGPAAGAQPLHGIPGLGSINLLNSAVRGVGQYGAGRTQAMIARVLQDPQFAASLARRADNPIPAFTPRAQVAGGAATLQGGSQ